MVVRGTRTSLARARMVRSARRSRSSRILSKNSSSSARTSSSSSSKTQSTSTTKQTKQISMYEEVQKAADGLQTTAKSLIELGTIKTTTTDATTTDTTAATDETTTADTTTSTSATTQTSAKTEEELKKEIIDGVKDMVEQYNTIYNNLDNLSGTVNTVFLSQLKSLVGSCEEALKKTGISVNKDGTLSITTKSLESTDLSTLKEVYCKSSGITGKLMNKCESIESNASSTISVLNRMYGTSTYNKYGSSSSYYGSSGSWYNAIG